MIKDRGASTCKRLPSWGRGGRRESGRSAIRVVIDARVLSRDGQNFEISKDFCFALQIEILTWSHPLPLTHSLTVISLRCLLLLFSSGRSLMSEAGSEKTRNNRCCVHDLAVPPPSFIVVLAWLPSAPCGYRLCYCSLRDSMAPMAFSRVR